MDTINGFAIAIAICALASFAQNASAENMHTDAPEAFSEAADDDVASNEQKKNFKSDEDDFVDKLMEKMPYSKSIKHTWNVLDGDVDLHFEDLRVDRGNKGVSYKMDSLPLFGHVDGLQFKASAGIDDSNISLRYKTAISW